MNYVLEYAKVCDVSNLPNPIINEKEELKCYFAPIGLFLETGREELVVYSNDYQRVRQYDKSGKYTVVATGLYKGSWGGPYVNHDGQVVAMH